MTDDAIDDAPPGEADEAVQQIQTHSVVKVGARSFAVGLNWELVSDLSTAKGEAAKLGKKHSRDRKGAPCDLWLLRPDAFQVGVGSTRRGQKSGMPVLAAELASGLPRSWIGFFEVRVGGQPCWYVAAGDKNVVDADGDLAISDFDVACDVFQDLHKARSATLFADAAVIARGVPGIDSFQAVDLGDLLSDPKAEHKLKRLSAAGELFRLARPFLFAAAAAYGATIVFPDEWRSLKVSAGLEEEQKKQVVVVPPMPWTGQPKALAVLDMCVDALSRVPRDGGGWTGGKLTCDGRVVRLELGRQGSVADKAPPIGWLDRWVDAQDGFTLSDGAKVAKPREGAVTSSSAVVTWVLPPIRDRWRDADRPPKDLDEQKGKLWRRLEDVNLRSSFATGSAQQFAETAKAAVLAEMSSAQEVRPTLDRPTMTISAVTYDPRTDQLGVSINMHKALAIPEGPNIEVQRSPDPREIESSRSLPPPEG